MKIENGRFKRMRNVYCVGWIDVSLHLPNYISGLRS